MDFTYEASGGIQVFGCASYKLVWFRRYRYRIGSIVFDKHKALKGIYEKVAIKDVRFPNPYVDLYVDTFNGLWNENELVSYETATEIIEEYILIRNAQLEEAVRMCKYRT